MRRIWTARIVQGVGKYGENAPMATVCCNACRTCWTTNIVGLVVAGVGGIALSAHRLANRLIG